jgi:hypothetical protein
MNRELKKHLNLSESEFIELIKEQMSSTAYDIISERFQLVNRVRGGETQRRKKVSSREGFTVRNGKIVKMKASERRTRSLSQRKAARKRKGKMSTSLRKRRISLRKRSRIN